MLEKLEPIKVFKYFEEICNIPHGSGNLDKILFYLENFAKSHSLSYEIDKTNNMLIKKDGVGCLKNSESIIIQGHLDMVCAKTNNCTKDMKNEGLDLIIDGDWLMADKTSLGADDGIAIAMALTLLEDNINDMPPLEVLFTSDEETGMYGAKGLDIKGITAKKLINIDSEEEGEFTVSCSGGTHIEFEINGTKVDNFGKVCYELEVCGLIGGHSGIEIHKCRANANTVLVRVIQSAIEKFNINLSNINGGEFDNVITTNSTAKIYIDKNLTKDFEEYIKNYDLILKNEYAESDKNIKLKATKILDDEKMYDDTSTKKIIGAMFLVPQGLIDMNINFCDIPETSINNGVVKTKGDIISITYLIRSNIDSKKEYITKKVKYILSNVDSKIKYESSYPAWQYKSNSKLKDICVECYKNYYGKEPKVTVTHGGLECGLFMDKIEGLDAISFGPTMVGVHTVDEKLNIPSVKRTYELLIEILKKC